MSKFKLFFSRFGLIVIASVFTACFAASNTTTDSPFVRAEALVAYRVILSTSGIGVISSSGETVTHENTYSTDIKKTTATTPKITFAVNTYTIKDSNLENTQYIACGSAPDYDVYCTNYFKSISLSSDQQSYLAYRAAEQHVVNDAEYNFYSDYTYTPTTIKYKASETDPNYIYFTLYPPANGSLHNLYETWIVPLDNFISLVHNNINNVCDDPTTAKYRFAELFGLPPDYPTSTRKFTLGHIDLKIADMDSSGVFTNGFFRPCTSFADTLSATACPAALDFTSIPAGEESYYNWIAKQYSSAYIDTSIDSQGRFIDGLYPWTAQGFSYNWYPWATNHEGLSEYVLAKNTDVYITETKTVEDIVKPESEGGYCPDPSDDDKKNNLATTALVVGGVAVAGTAGYLITHPATS